MYTYVYFCLLPACLPSWLAGILASGGPRLRLVKFLNYSIKKINQLDLWRPRLRLVKFLNDSIKKINHLELWKSQAQTGQVPL